MRKRLIYYIFQYKIMNDVNIQKYVSERKEWLEELAISGNRVVRAIALAVLKVAGNPSPKRSDYV